MKMIKNSLTKIFSWLKQLPNLLWRFKGQLLIAAGFLSAAFFAVQDIKQVNWHFYLIALVAGAFGIFIVRLENIRTHRSEKKIDLNLQNVQTALSRIAENITRLNNQKQTINTYDIRHHIDRLFTGDMESFVEARHSIAHRYSLQAYADVMNHFAAGQRYLNRVWSASADGYIDEVNTYIEKAQTQFIQASQIILGIEAQS